MDWKIDFVESKNPEITGDRRSWGLTLYETQGMVHKSR